MTVGVSSEAKQLNSWRVSDYTPEYRQTRSIGKRKLLTPDEILRLPLDTALIILRGQKVLQVEKYDYTLHPDAQKLIPRKASEHIPEWRKGACSEEYTYTPTIPASHPKKTASYGKQKRKKLNRTLTSKAFIRNLAITISRMTSQQITIRITQTWFL